MDGEWSGQTGRVSGYRRTGAQASVAYMKPLILLDLEGVLNP